MKPDGRACRGDSEIDLCVGMWWAVMAGAFTVLVMLYVF